MRGSSILLSILWLRCCDGFILVPNKAAWKQSSNLQPKTSISAISSASSTDASSSIQIFMKDAESKIVQSNGKVDIKILDPILENIEAQNTYEEPNRQPVYKGKWHVWYSTAPPPFQRTIRALYGKF